MWSLPAAGRVLKSGFIRKWQGTVDRSEMALACIPAAGWDFYPEQQFQGLNLRSGDGLAFLRLQGQPPRRSEQGPTSFNLDRGEPTRWTHSRSCAHVSCFYELPIYDLPLRDATSTAAALLFKLRAIQTEGAR